MIFYYIRKLLCIIVLLSVTGYVDGQNLSSVIRTPKDYLFCADGAYNKEKLEQTSDTLPPRPEYLKKLTNRELFVLDKAGFYEDFLTGYAGAVFMDTRDSTIIISHRATELAHYKSDIRDIAADAQLAGSDKLSKVISSLAKKSRSEEEVNEMIEIGLQYPSAKKLFEAVKRQFPKNNIEQTGHSLGGSTTQLLAYEFGTKGITFDPAGVGNKIYLNIAKKENINNITNYKVHQSLVSSSVTTGKNIGKIVTIYPTDGKNILATKSHGIFEIFTLSLNHNTGYFKTLNEVTQELWENNGYISEIKRTGMLKVTRIQTKIQDKFKTIDEYREYFKKAYNIVEQQDDTEALNQNSVQFYLANPEDTDTLKPTGSFIFINSTVEKGTFQVVEHKNKLFILLDKTDLLKIITRHREDKSIQKIGTYQLEEENEENKSEEQKDH